MQHLIGLFSVVMAGIGFGFLGIFGRLAFDTGMSVGLLLTLRFFSAALALGLIFVITRPRLFVLPKRQVVVCIFLGVFGYAVFSSLYFYSIQGLSVSLAAMLLFTFPLFVNLGEHFIFKEALHPIEILLLGLAFSGLILLLWGPLFFESLKYIVAALGAAVTYSIYVLVSGRVQQRVHPMTSSFYVILAAAVALYIFHRPEFASAVSLTKKQWIYVGGLSIICTILPITLFLVGLQRMKSGLASLIVMIEPVVAALAAAALLAERLTLVQYLGMTMIIAALLFSSWRRLKPKTL
jgi:drug/metabolite transporter (DMT)-like permease